MRKAGFFFGEQKINGGPIGITSVGNHDRQEASGDTSPPASVHLADVNGEDVDSEPEYVGSSSYLLGRKRNFKTTPNGDVEEAENEFTTSEEHLKLAQDRIQELEARLEVRERELRLAQFRARKLAHQGRRLRRLARSGDLFRSSQTVDSDDIERALKQSSDSGYIVLSIVKICRDLANNYLNYEDDIGDAESHVVPLYLRKLEGQMFVVGESGAVIGSGSNSTIEIPPEGRVYSNHAIVYKENNTFYIKPGTSADAMLFSEEENTQSTDNNRVEIKEPFPLSLETIFITGIVKWSVHFLPKHKHIIGEMFKAVRSKDIGKLMEECKHAQDWNTEIARRFPKHPNLPTYTIYGNTEEDLDYTYVDEKSKDCSVRNAKGCRRDSSLITTSEEKQEKFSLLHVAVDFGFLRGVQMLLKQNAEVNMQSTRSKLTPLHIAVRHNDLNVLNELLKHGADLEITDAEYNSPIRLAETYPVRRILLSSLMLCYAADAGDLAEVKRLLELGISPDVKGSSHKSPLHLASLNGHVSTVQYLLENGASVNNLGGRRKRTPLHYASLGDHYEVGKLLVERGADEEIVDSLGYTALNLSNGGEMCRLLHKGTLSLCLATQAGDVDEVRKILENNSTSRRTSAENGPVKKKISLNDTGRRISRQFALSNLGLCLAVDQRNEQGHAPLHLAATAGNMELVQLLIAYGAFIDLPGGLDKWTPLFYASLAGHVDVVGFLVYMGADVDRTDVQGFTVLEHIEKNIEEFKDKLESNRGNRELSEIISANDSQNLLVPPHFMRQRSDSSLPGKDERSWMKRQLGRLQHVLSILQSCQQKLMEVLESRNLKRLIEVLSIEDVDVNAPLTKSSLTTALHYCGVMGLPDFTRILLQANADPYLGDSNSFTPMHCAARYGHEDVIQTLVKAKVNVNLKTQSQGYTPLHVAAINSREDAVRTLLNSGADPKIKDHDGLLPFDLATELSIQTLLARDECLLYVAAATGNVSEMRKFLGKYDVDTRFRFGLTPLLVACEWGQFEVAEVLLQSGADASKTGGRCGSSPLHIAARKGHTDMVSLLIQYHARLSQCDHDSKTPFEVATTNSVRKLMVNASSMRQRTLENTIDGEGDATVSEGSKCRICFDNPINTIILPCGHQAFCKDCACQLECCAFDRRPISQVVPVIFCGMSVEDN